MTRLEENPIHDKALSLAQRLATATGLTTDCDIISFSDATSKEKITMRYLPQASYANQQPLVDYKIGIAGNKIDASVTIAEFQDESTVKGHIIGHVNKVKFFCNEKASRVAETLIADIEQRFAFIETLKLRNLA